MTNPGIDYSRGLANRNFETGIHYGAISVNSLAGWVMGEADPDYGPAQLECPKCKCEFEDATAGHGDEVTCPDCGFEEVEVGDMAWPDMPLSWDTTASLGDEYESDYSETLNCIFILKSPYFTETIYCSPCAPGAGDLDSPRKGGIKTYCVGHDGFEEGHAPYPVYSIETGERILSGKETEDETDPVE